MLSKLRRSVHTISNLDAAWRKIQINGQSSNSEDVRVAIEKFAQNPTKHIAALQRKLSRNQFDFGSARGAPIKKVDGKGQPTGKVRPIVIGTLEARIVQRAILQILVDIPKLKPFLETPHSFGGLRKKPKSTDEEEPSLAAVPAAIKSVLQSIEQGSRWVAAADITAFFTRISKSAVLTIIEDAVADTDLIALVKQAIAVELSNLATLRDLADQFPIEDIGVAQGNSLSPLLGNIILAEFDKAMNTGDCRCIRYIDDFIILAPTKKAANARLVQARKLLDELEMTLSEEKSSRDATHINDGFEFLGIEIVPGLVRPARKARRKFLSSLQSTLQASQSAMLGLKHGNALDSRLALIPTLKRANGMVEGWGKHYWFCNDRQTFSAIDGAVRTEIRKHLGVYGSVRKEIDERFHDALLGITSLSKLDRSPFQYPKLSE